MEDFNVNNDIMVRLTDTGRKELKRQWDEIHPEHPTIFKKYTPKTEDKDGWSRWQMWDIMAHLGHLMRNGVGRVPFETTIRLNV